MAKGNNIYEKLVDIANQKAKISNWLFGIGKANASSKLEDCAEAISHIEVYLNRNDYYISEGESYTIPAGYHDGTQVIINTDEVAGDKYKLYSYAPITPTEVEQNFSIPAGYWGLSAFKVNPIPYYYKNVSNVTAVADDVLYGKLIMTKDGSVAGTMYNNGKVNATIDGLSNTIYKIPKGYHNGEGTVKLTDDIERKLAEI